MESKEKFFNTSMITNLLLAFTLIISVLYYLQNQEEIKEEMSAVVVNSLRDVNSSLAEQDSSRK